MDTPVKIDGTDLENELAAFMLKILNKIQIKINSEYEDKTLGSDDEDEDEDEDDASPDNDECDWLDTW